MAKRAYKPKTVRPKISHANRGMQLQNIINKTNEIYDIAGLASVQEVPTPTKKGKDEKIKYIKKSTVDYYGCANGQALAFDAKSTLEEKYFPLKNVEPHQVSFLKNFGNKHNGIAFLIVEFASLYKTYFVPIEFFNKYWFASKNGGPKHIPFADIDKHCPRIMPTRGVALDYLAHCQTGGKNDEYSVKKGGLTIPVQ